MARKKKIQPAGPDQEVMMQSKEVGAPEAPVSQKQFEDLVRKQAELQEMLKSVAIIG